MSKGLLTYRTDLKSLKFGNDRPGLNSSNQPYIKSDIPSEEEDIKGNQGDQDFILRGGIGAPLDAVDDVVRLTKYFTDLKSVSGPLFVVKQNVLSRIAPATQASGRLNWKKAALNEGIYTPLSTLAQAGIGFLGGHLDKQGINPITGIKTYSDVSSLVIGTSSGNGNRLVDLTNTNKGVFSGPTIFSYSGGPNSSVGIGRTNIKYAKDNQGGTLRVLGNESYTDSFIKSQTGLKGSDTDRSKITTEFRSPWGATKKFAKIAGGKIENFNNPNNTNQIFNLNGVDLDFISSEDGVTWDNVVKNTTIDPYTKPTILASSKKGYTGQILSSQFKAPWGATKQFAKISGGSVETAGDTQLYFYTKDKLLTDVLSPSNGKTWENLEVNPFMNPYTTKPNNLKPSVKKDSLRLFKSPLGASRKYAIFTGGDVEYSEDIYATEGGGYPGNLASITKNAGVWEPLTNNVIGTGKLFNLALGQVITPSQFDKTPNPTNLFKYNQPQSPLNKFISINKAAGGQRAKLASTVDSNSLNYSTSNGLSWQVPFTNPYATGIKGTLSTGVFKDDINRRTSWGPNSGLIKYKPDSYASGFFNQILSGSNYTPINTQLIGEVSARGGRNVKNRTTTVGYTNTANSVYEGYSLNPSLLIKDNTSFNTLTQPQIYKKSQDLLEKGKGSIVDFRKGLIKDDPATGKKKSTIMSIAPNYATSQAIIDNSTGINNYHYTTPGQKGDITSYTKGKVIDDEPNSFFPKELGSKEGSVVDKINAYPIYQSTEVNGETDKFGVGDLVNFRIEAIGNHQGSNPTQKQYIHFRAYIDSFEDSYTGNWDSLQYMGRGEKFHKYQSFERSISLGFTVAAQSRPELMAQYKKLNYLVSNLAPSYSEQGYMGGPLVMLTMGNWCFELPGFIGGVSLGVPEESPWEIAIDDNGNRDPDKGIMQLPHIVKVSGFNFTPIHTFRPSKQSLTFNDDDTITYGIQKYLAYRKTKVEEATTPEDEPVIDDEDEVIDTDDLVIEGTPFPELTVPPLAIDNTSNEMNTAVGTKTLEYQFNQDLQGTISKVNMEEIERISKEIRESQPTLPTVINASTGQLNLDIYTKNLKDNKDTKDNQFLFYQNTSE